MRKKFVLLTSLVTCGLFTGIVSSCVGNAGQGLFSGVLSKSTNAPAPAESLSVGGSDVSACRVQQNGYADLVEKLLPAVVNVSAVGVEEVMINPFDQFFGKGLFNDDVLSQFFGNRNTIKRKTNSRGSAFFISEDGLLVTNYHVIKDAKEITITTQTREEFQATVLGVDKKTDLAVLRVKTKRKFPFVKFGNSNQARIGDAVIAIGNPFNLGSTVTAGIISAKSRRIGMHYDDFIQIDAPLNMGNSGGPSFNTRGEVIGVNTMIVSHSGGNIGLGFAIPSEVAIPVINKLKEGKKVQRSMLGVIVQPVTKEIAEAVGLEKVIGALVVNVVKGGPADKAKIQKGDVILKFNNVDIAESSDLPGIASNIQAEKHVPVELMRYGKQISVQVEMARDTDVESLSRKFNEHHDMDIKEEVIHGFVVRDIDNVAVEKLQLHDNIRGVLVVKVKNDDIAESNAVVAGDIIMQVNNYVINSTKEFKDAMNKVKAIKKQNAIFYIFRNGVTLVQGVTINSN